MRSNGDPHGPRADDSHRRAMATVRRRLRQYVRARETAEQGRVRTLRAAVKFPLRALREARHAVVANGAETQAAYGVSPQRQLAELTALRLRYGITAEAYYRLRLFLPARRRDAWAYLLPDQNLYLVKHPAQDRPTEATAILNEKSRFDAWARRHGLPAASVLWTVNGAPSPDRPQFTAVDLVSKPLDGRAGRGVVRWCVAADGGAEPRWRDDSSDGADGASVTAEELVAAVAAAARGEPFIIQRRVVNHPGVADLTGGGLGTVRAVTVLDDAGTPTLVRAVYRMPTGRAAADNFDLGGLAAPIDLATGTLGPAVRKRGGAMIADVPTHADTGATITGRTLPTWGAVQALVARAHAALPPIAIVGWDVGLAPDGPILIEGNVCPCSMLSQMPSGVPLGRTPYVQRMLELAPPRVK